MIWNRWQFFGLDAVTLETFTACPTYQYITFAEQQYPQGIIYITGTYYRKQKLALYTKFSPTCSSLCTMRVGLADPSPSLSSSSDESSAGPNFALSCFSFLHSLNPGGDSEWIQQYKKNQKLMQDYCYTTFIHTGGSSDSPLCNDYNIKCTCANFDTLILKKIGGGQKRVSIK